jgi:hypothetical protein
MHTQSRISHICHLAQLGRKSSQFKVKYILDNCLLFSRCELKVIWLGLSSRGDSIKSIREPLAFNNESCCSASQGLELAKSIRLKGKINSAFFLNSNCVVLLRHCLIRRKLVVPRKSGRLSGGIRYKNQFFNFAKNLFLASFSADVP